MYVLEMKPRESFVDWVSDDRLGEFEESKYSGEGYSTTFLNEEVEGGRV